MNRCLSRRQTRVVETLIHCIVCLVNLGKYKQILETQVSIARNNSRVNNHNRL